MNQHYDEFEDDEFQSEEEAEAAGAYGDKDEFGYLKHISAPYGLGCLAGCIGGPLVLFFVMDLLSFRFPAMANPTPYFILLVTASMPLGAAIGIILSLGVAKLLGRKEDGLR